MTLSFNDLVDNNKFKNKATSIETSKNYQVLSSIGLNNVDINLIDRPFSSDLAIVYSHPSK